jgi:DNA-binding MarR family transcriptional regulator
MTDQRPIGFWLKLVDRMINERFASTLEEHGVTRRQWQLLGVLSRGPATVQQLSESVAPVSDSADDESVVDHLSELVESGWVTASPAGYEITPRGSTAFNRLAEVVQANRELATEGVPEAEYNAMVATLEHIARNLGWGDDDPASDEAAAKDPASNDAASL